MPKLIFRFGTMNSSKTANLLMTAHNYISQGKKILLIKPSIDTRSGNDIIHSRAINGMSADLILERENDSFNIDNSISCVFIDEAQFLSSKNVERCRQLTSIAPVICYGLRTDYKGNLFEGSKRLFELSDNIEEIKNICQLCEQKAIINAKFLSINDKNIIIKHGSSNPDIGAEEKYKPLCWKCWDEMV